MIRNRNVIKKTGTIKPRRNNTRAFAQREPGGVRIEINATPECGATALQRVRHLSIGAGKPLFLWIFRDNLVSRAIRCERRRMHRDAGRSPRIAEAFDIFNTHPAAAPAAAGREEKSPGFRRGFRYDRSQ